MSANTAFGSENCEGNRISFVSCASRDEWNYATEEVKEKITLLTHFQGFPVTKLFNNISFLLNAEDTHTLVNQIKFSRNFVYSTSNYLKSRY